MTFLKDEKGKTSSGRIMAFISLFSAIWYGYLSIMQTSDIGLYLAISFLVAAFAGKSVQKFAEMSLPKK